MTTPSGEDPGGTPPSDPAWSWEPKTFGDPAPSPIPRAADLPAEPEVSPVEVEPPPPAGLAWDTTRSPGASDAPPVEEPVGAPPPPPPPEKELGVSPASDRYPMRFDVAYPEGLSRWKTLLRWFFLVPLLFSGMIIALLLGIGLCVGYMTVFWRKKYPEWLFHGMAGSMAFLARTYSYAFLLTDKFPSFSPEDSPVTLEFDSPPSGDLSRWRVVFWKSILLWPMQIVLQFLLMAVGVVTFLAWFAILLAGNYPRGLFQFSVGVQRWYWRMSSYAASFNDRYPPYALSADAGPGGNASVVINGVVGGVLAATYGAFLIAVAATSGPKFTEDVDYAQLVAGRDQQSHVFDVDFSEDQILLRLSRAVDPGDSLIQVIRPASTERIVVFQWTVVNGSKQSQVIAEHAARLKYRYEDEGDDKEKTVNAQIIGVNNVTTPARVGEGGTATVQAVFVIPEDAEPLALWFEGGFAGGGVRYDFE